MILLYNSLHDTSFSIEPNNSLYFKIVDYINTFREKVKKEPSYEDIVSMSQKIEKLKKIKQPEQRTPEWYEYRSNRLTASDLATALNKNPYSDRNTLIAKKCGYEEKFNAGKAVLHGIKFEDIAIHIYEKRFNLSVYEYGCLPHPDIEYFGASPDGIVDPMSINKSRIGRMLEIKCPKSRPITGIVPEYYELQIQGQLEVCDLDYCDFLECDFQDYTTIDDVVDDTHEDSFDKTKDNMERGFYIEYFDTTKNKTNHLYHYTMKSLEDVLSWRDNEIDKIVSTDHLEYIHSSFWKLQKFSIVLVKRDKDRFDNILLPEITRFWNDVLHHRQIGYESLIKKKKSYNTTPKNELTFLPD